MINCVDFKDKINIIY